MSPKPKRVAKGARKAPRQNKVGPLSKISRSLDRVPPFTLLLFFGIFLCLGLFLLEGRMFWPGSIAFLACLLTARRISVLPKSPYPSIYPLVWVAGLILALYGFLAVPALTLNMPWVPAFHASQPWPSVTAGLALMVLGFAGLQGASKDPQPGIWTSRSWLFVILAVAAWLRLKHFQDPFNGYGFDSAVSMMQGRTALDFADERYLVFPYSAQPPFYEYLIMFGFGLFPNLSSILLQNILWPMIDLAAIWIHYLLGKEIGGRRTGLFLAAAMALSKPMLSLCMSTMHPVSVPLAIGIILLFTFRYLNQPSLSRAIQWGAATAFPAYCYTSTRPYLWWIPVAVTIVVLWRHRRSREPLYWTLGASFLVLWTYFFFRFNGYLPSALELNRWGSAALLLVLGFLFYLARQRSDRSSPYKNLVTLGSGLFAAGLILYPIVTHELFAGWASGYSIFNKLHPEYHAGGMSLGYLLERVGSVFEALFTGFPDIGSFSFTGEAFFSMTSVPWILAGTAWLFARPGWKGAFLILCALVGSITHILSHHSHTGRLAAMLTPLLLIGALGLDAFWRGLLAGQKARLGTGLGLVLLLVYGWWAADTLRYRFDVVWAKQPTNEVVLLREIRKDASQYRLYIWDDGAWCNFYTMSALVDEGHDVHIVGPEGVNVPLADKKAPNVVVYLNGYNDEVLKRMRRNFKHAKEEAVYNPGQPSRDRPMLVKFYIDGKDLRWGQPFGKPLFTRVSVTENSWRVRAYKFRNGLSGAVIRREDWLTGELGVLPAPIAVETVRVDGSIRVLADGKYVFSVAGGNFAVVDVDGKRVLDYRPSFRAASTGQRESVRLKAGEHQVTLRTYLQVGLGLPPVKVQFPGETAERALGSF